MTKNLTNLIICPDCGSTEYMEDYPAPGQKLCTECGHESIEIKLKTIGSTYELLKECPFCGEERKKGAPLYEDDFTTVFKCKKCGKLAGYCDLGIPFAIYEAHESAYTHLACEIAKDEGKPILSRNVNRKIAAALKKHEKSPKSKCQKKLIRLIKEKDELLKRANMDPLLVSRARNQAQNEIQRNGPYTEKQLQILYPAALLEAQETLLRLGQLKKKELTERQLEKIFTADRKTLRKWKKNLIKQNRLFKFQVHIRQKGQPREYAVIEFPTEVKSITILEPPYKETCDFCEKTQVLSYRIIYSNESWSDVCAINYESLKHMAFQYGWETEKALFPK